jgi:Family of unknown function (DUF6464)
MVGYALTLSLMIFLPIGYLIGRYLIYTIYSSLADRTWKSKSIEVGKCILTGILCLVAIAGLSEILALLIKTLGACFIPVCLLVYMVGKSLIARQKASQRAEIVDRERYLDRQISGTNYEDSLSSPCDLDLSVDYEYSACDFDISWDEVDDLYYDSDRSQGIGDLTCIYNARSPLIRCAVNPYVECEDCQHYERSS